MLQPKLEQEPESQTLVYIAYLIGQGKFSEARSLIEAKIQDRDNMLQIMDLLITAIYDTERKLSE